VRIGADGTVNPAGVGLFTVANARKVGDALLQGTAAAGRAAGQVRSGALEGSGSDPTRAMVDMIASLRAYESGQKVITTIDTTLGKAANQVGSL
jgi:flagellar basal-body rod protein FlgF